MGRPVEGDRHRTMRKPLSVQKRMTGIILLVSLLVLIVTSVQFLWFEFNRVEKLAEGDLHSLARVISATAALPMALKDHVKMQAILNSLEARPDMASAYLLSPKGRAFVRFPQYFTGNGRDWAEQIALEERQITAGRRAGTDILQQEKGLMSHFAPVFHDGDLVGYSYLSFETRGMQQEKLLMLLSWLVTMGVALVLTYLLSRRLQRYISQPIEKLAAEMHKVSQKKRLIGPIHQDVDDEFGLLFRGFEEMIRSLRQRDQQLEEHRKKLKWQVQQRTQALAVEKEKAEQANLAKSRFLANMSHEIRTPMIGVLGAADLLRHQSLEERHRVLVEMIYQSGEALLAILDDILDFSRIEAGQLKLDLVPIDLQTVVRDVVRLMAVNAHSKGIELSLELPETLPAVVGDPGRIRQILLNLIGNAVKFTTIGAVRVSVQVSEDQEADLCPVLFVVEDTGEGIDPQAQKRIFDSFDQGDDSTTRRYGGAGLGLAIVRDLVALMGGQIQVNSQAGQGSTFKVTLPLALAEDAAPQRPGPEKTLVAAEPLSEDTLSVAVNGAPRRVLLVEDNPTTQSLIAILFEPTDYALMIVDNGRAAIDFIRKQPVDLILMDCQMPEMDGFKATRELRAMGVTIPIIALTAYARDEEREQCLAAGMDDFLSKPFRQAEMRSILQKWLPPDARDDGHPQASSSS